MRARMRENEIQYTELALLLGIKRLNAWDRVVTEATRTRGELSSLNKLQEIVDGFTDKEEAEFRDFVEGSLRRYAAKNPQWASWWRGFWQSVAASAAWSVFLLAAYLIVRYVGSDWLNIFSAPKPT